MFGAISQEIIMGDMISKIEKIKVTAEQDGNWKKAFEDVLKEARLLEERAKSGMY